MSEHPLLRARRAPGEAWLVPDVASRPGIDVVEATTDRELPELRGQLVSRGFDLECGPAVRFGVIRAPGGDHVLAVADHALVDGVGIGRVIVSLLSSYAGGRAGTVDVRWRHAHALAAAAPPAARVEATVRTLRGRAAAGSVRLARERSGNDAGYGVAYHRVSARAVDALASAPMGRSTANDVVVTAFCLAGMEWNLDHGAPALPFAVGVPLNLRPARGWLEGVCNATLPWPVQVDEQDPGDVLQLVTGQLRAVRTGLYSAEVRGLLAYLAGREGPALPLWLRAGLAATTTVSTVPGAETVRIGGATIGGLYGGAPAPGAVGMTFAVIPDAGAYRLSARFLRSHQSLAGAARFLTLVDTAIVTVCEALARRASGVLA